nr:GerMN domain-containing protein [Lachnospiraceae bacterium]
MKKVAILIWMFVLMLCAGCGKENQPREGQAYTIYEVNKEETKVVERTIYTTETDSDELVKLFMNELCFVTDNAESRPAILNAESLLSFDMIEGNVTIDFSSEYSSMPVMREILARAAIVRTLTQIEDVKYVTILVEGNPLLNRSGVPVGVMTAEQFLDNSGNVINTEEIASLSLYFADEDGKGLVPVNREVVYSSNIPLEKLVVEQLIKGVREDEEGAYPVLDPNIKINAVTVRDGVCYVNLDSTFLAQTTGVSAEVTIYSMVNSLVELSDVNKVQFSVNGENELTFKETMPLSEVYGRNLELVGEAE